MEPLAVIGLEVPGRYVVQNRKAVDVIHGFADGDVRPFFADDDGQFPFVVDLFGHILMGFDRVVRPDDGRRGLGEDDRILRLVGQGRLIEFGDVVGVVFADAEDVSFHMGNGSHEADRIEGLGLYGAGLFVLFEGIGQG